MQADIQDRFDDEQPNLFTRPDTFFGVCQGIGEDFGFNPQFLRIALALGLFVNPVAVLATYAGLAVLVLASRLIFPDARRPAASVATVAEAEAVPAAAAPEMDAEPLAKAA